MNKALLRGTIVFISFLFTITGCVSKDLYLAKTKDVESLQADLEKANKRIQDLTSEIQGLKDEGARLKEDNSRLKGDLDFLKETMKKELEAMIRDAEEIVHNKEKEMAEVEYGYRKVVDDLQREIAGHRKDKESQAEILKELEKKNAELLATIEEKEKEISGQKDEIQACLTDRQAQTKKIEELTTQIDEQKGKIEELMARAGILSEEREKEISGLKDEIREQARKIEELTGTTAAQAREIDELREKTGLHSKEKEKEIERLKGTYDSLVKELQDEIKRGEIKITHVRDKLSLNLVEKVLFDSGSADIKPEGKKVLDRVAPILKVVTDKQIRIEGHTDDKPIGPKIAERFSTNWELSTARATNVVRYLQDNGKINPKVLSAAGYSLYRPVTGNETKEGRLQNRRIEIVLLPLDVDRILEELK